MPDSPSTSTSRSAFHRLSDDELHNVLGFVDMAGLCNAAIVSKRWATIVEPLLRRAYVAIPSERRHPVPSGRFKDSLVSFEVWFQLTAGHAGHARGGRGAALARAM
jgi:hypothetical protein